MIEQRLHFRMTLRTDAWILEAGKEVWHNVNLLDISVSGAAFINVNQMLPGASFVLRFSLPGNPMQMKLEGNVVNCREHQFFSGYRVGIKFLIIEEEARALLAQFIDASRRA